MGELIKLFEKIAEYYGHTVSSIIMLVIIISYSVYIILKNYSSTIKKYFENKLLEKEKQHVRATQYRKDITPKVKHRLSELALSIKADRALLFEFSNGTSNLLGLPFLFISATTEVLSRETLPMSNTYQKINVSLIAEFLDKLEQKGYYYTENIISIKDEYPILFNMLDLNNIKSVLFYGVSGELGEIGFLMVATNRNNTFTREAALPEVAHTAQLISSYLNFNILDKEL